MVIFDYVHMFSMNVITKGRGSENSQNMGSFKDYVSNYFFIIPNNSMGSGKIIVEFFSAEILLNV